MNVLFVDDDSMVLNGIKRSLFGSDWNISYVASGEEALKTLGDEKIDVVVSDMRMPRMDGTELMTQVQELYPQIVRIILSGYADQDCTLRASHVTHKWLEKPCSIKNLIDTLQQVEAHIKTQPNKEFDGK